MGDDKVKESPGEVFATVADVNSAIHSLDDVFGVRFDAVEEKLAAMDVKNESRFEAVDARFQALEVRFRALEEKLAATDIRNERRFEVIETRFQAVDARFRSVEEKLAAADVENERRFAALGKEIAELDAKVEGGFSLLVEKINSQDLKIARSVTSAANKQLIMMLVIAGSIIASLLYTG